MKKTILTFILATIFVVTTTAQNYQWAKSIGTISPFGFIDDDMARSIALDAGGNIYVTGYFHETVDFDPGVGTSNLTSYGAYDVFIAKYDGNGDYLWANNVGGISFDQSISIFVDGSGNVYVTGYFSGTASFNPIDLNDTLTSFGSNDIFFAKYDTDGNYLWAKAVGATSFDIGISITIDDSDNVYLAGHFSGTADFDPSASTNTISAAGGTASFFAKYDLNGNYLWAKSIGSTNTYNSANCIKIDGLGNIFMTSYFQGVADFDPSPSIANLTAVGGMDMVLAKYDSNGNYLWAKSVGSSNDDLGGSIAIDASNNVYVTGYYHDTVDFNPGAATNTLTSQGGSDMYIAKYDINGNYLWAKSVGGSGDDEGYSIIIDALDNVYAIGGFHGTVDFDPNAATAYLNSAGGLDMYFAKYDINGNYLWAASVGGSIGDDFVKSLALDALGNFYVTGAFEGTVDFDPGASTSFLTSEGGVGLDAFIAKYSDVTTSIVEGNNQYSTIRIYPNPAYNQIYFSKQTQTVTCTIAGLPKSVSSLFF
jgi:hypothetical protein